MRCSGIFAAAILLAAPAAQACPDVVVDEVRREALMAQVRVAPDASTAQALTNELWEIWTNAPDARAQALLDNGIERRAAFDLEEAIVAFDALIDYCPSYAEGYNQRAFVLFIRQDFTAAIADLDVALARSPEHLGALTGRAMALMALGRDAEALRDLRAALALNPWLKERSFVPVLEHRLGDTDL